MDYVCSLLGVPPFINRDFQTGDGAMRFRINLLHVNIPGKLGIGMSQLTLNRLVGYLLMVLNRCVTPPKPMVGDIGNTYLRARGL